MLKNNSTAVITLAQLKSQSTQKVAFCHLDWGNFLFITALGDDQTLVCLTSGELVQINQPLKKVISELARKWGITDFTTKVLYLKYPRIPQSLVAGNHRLIPSAGAGAPERVYYLEQYLRSFQTWGKSEGVLLDFYCPQTKTELKLVLDVAENRFKKIRDVALKIAKAQKVRFKWLGNFFGFRSFKHNHVWEQRQEANHCFFYRWLVEAIISYNRETLGEPRREEVERFAKRLMSKPFQIN